MADPHIRKIRAKARNSNITRLQARKAAIQIRGGQMPILKILKITDKPDGSALIDFEFDKEKLYPIIKKVYSKKRASKKLVGKFVREALIEYARTHRLLKRDYKDKK